MHTVAQRIVPALVLLAALQPALGSACPIMNKEQAAERHRQIVDETKAEIVKLKEQADLIFIGRLSKLTFEREAADKDGWQHHQAVFTVDRPIKGQYPEGQALQFATNRNRVWISVGCRPQFWQLPTEKGEGEAYLVYAREGKILRTNHIPDRPQALGAYEEAAFIDGER
jgi:hypothetical protein